MTSINGAWDVGVDPGGSTTNTLCCLHHGRKCFNAVDRRDGEMAGRSGKFWWNKYKEGHLRDFLIFNFSRHLNLQFLYSISGQSCVYWVNTSFLPNIVHWVLSTSDIMYTIDLVSFEKAVGVWFYENFQCAWILGLDSQIITASVASEAFPPWLE